MDEHSFYNSVFLSDPNASQVLIFAYPSAGFLDWSSPTTLAWTAVVSEVKRHLLDRSSAIGHAQFAWYCKGEGKEVVYGASGQSGLVHGQDVEAVFNGWGLSVLQLVFTDGNALKIVFFCDGYHRVYYKCVYVDVCVFNDSCTSMYMSVLQLVFTDGNAQKMICFVMDTIRYSMCICNCICIHVCTVYVYVLYLMYTVCIFLQCIAYYKIVCLELGV